MIITVTMNPAIDKTVDIAEFVHGGLNRIKRVEQDAGGKGINVSKTIQELGGETVAVGFVGGTGGGIIKNTLEQYGIETDFIHVDGETRTNTKVVEEKGTVTELNEPGPVITKEQMDALLEKLNEYAGENTLFVLSGSVPAGVDKGIYRDIIVNVHARGAKVLLDADGELFLKGLEASPDIIKPNIVELQELFGMTENLTIEDTALAGAKLLEKGVELIAVSCGAEGAVFLSGEKKYRCEGLRVKAHSTVGAGDAMVAALAFGYHQEMALEEMIPLSIAASAGAVTTIGTKPPARSVVDQLKKEVTVIEF